MKVFFQYQIHTTLHEGIETSVYRGQTPTHQGSTILKLLKAEYPTLEAITRLKHEYQIRQNLDHRGIVKALSLETFNHRLALLLEDFGGDSLAQLLQKEKLTLTNCLSIVIQLVKALDYLHQNQIIHKDIKPSNIIINANAGIIKLTDFGIASRLNKENPLFNNPNSVEGTLAYMSPEQTGRMNRTLDYRTDFYSLGVTLYEMLTGQLPFQSHDPLEIVYSHIAQPPTPLNQLNSEIPLAISEIVMKLMAKNAEDRYQSAAGLLTDLEICLNQLTTTGKISDFIPGRLDVLSQLLIPQKLYGREKQVDLLLAAFDRVGAGSPTSSLSKQDTDKPAPTGTRELMLVSGYSGIGKSAVVNEVNKPITRQRGYFISGKFDQFKRNIPYASITQAFASLIGQLLTETTLQLQDWRDKIIKAVGSNGQVIIDVIPEVELIIGKQPEVPQLGPTESQNRFNRVFKEFIRVFTQKEHPLVIFLDDLQWTDSATLKLMQLLVTDPESQYLLFIGAYRDNEVSPTHPLIQTLEDIQKTGTTINNILLQPLDLENVKNLVSDTLNNTKDVQDLAELICNKTVGNPFFLTQLIQALYQENLLKFDFSSASWQWCMEEIQAIGITEKSVVELVAGRIQKLAEATQEVLKLAACVGDKFTLDVLSIVNEQTPSTTASELYSALQVGFILPLSEAYKIPLVFDETEVESNKTIPSKIQSIKSKIASVGYRFLHDRVQQAAYSLIPESSKKETHLKIGKLLLQAIPESDIEENIFEIVNQLNIGVDFISDPAEKVKLAQLNLIAGQKAKAAMAYEAAVKYLTEGLSLTAIDSWTYQYDLTLSLYVEAVEAQYLNTNFEKAKALSEVCLKHAKTLLDKVKVYEIKMQFHIQQHQMQTALDIGLQVLDMLKVSLVTERPKELDAQELDDLPEMTDPTQLAAMRILMNLCAPTYVLDPVLNKQVAFTMVDFCIQHGRSALAAFGYGLYDLIVCGLRDIDAGYRAGKLALRLLTQFDAKELKAKIYGLFYAHASVWKDPVKETLAPLLEGIQSGLETGDIEWAGYNSFYYCDHLLFSGEPLELVAQKQAQHFDFMLKRKQILQSYYLNIWRRLVLKLQGVAEEKYSFHGELVTDAEILQGLIAAKNQMFTFPAYLVNAIIHYLLKDYDQSVINASLASDYQGGVTGMVINSTHNFYYSLALLAQVRCFSEGERAQVLKQVRSHQEIMHNWALHAPCNFQHKYDLVEAEKARVLGKTLKAIDYYDRAISGAREQGYIQEEALANELAAEFYFACGRDKIAKVYLTDAYYGYIRWGAITKVKDLELQHPFLVAQTHTTETPKLDITLTTTTTGSSTSNLFSTALDLATFIKFSQAITSEIVLENLLSKLIKLLLKNAAAQKAVLLLLKGNQLYIEAIGTATDDAITVLKSIPATLEDLPLLVVNYAFRSKKTLILNDATATEPYNTYPYIQKFKPKSILCLPIIYQSKLQGMIYLENNLTVGAFVQERVEVLNVLASQVAIALENALLYENLETANQQLKEYSFILEEKVEQRTAALKAAQKQIIAKEKLSSLGALTAGVAHELRNPLNFVNNYAEGSVELSQELLEEIDNQSDNLDADTLDYIKETLTDLKDNAAAIHQHGQRAEGIIHSMMQHARTDGGQRQSTDLNALLDQAVQLVYHSRRVSQHHFNVTMHKDYDASIGQLEVVSADLNRAFINIIDNACYAVHQKQKDFQQALFNEKEVFTPTLWLKTHNLGETVEIRIRDNGMGVQTEVREKIFHPFFTTKPTGEGTGLGLSLTNDIIVGQHGGTLQVESEPGAYTEFIITLPRALSV